MLCYVLVTVVVIEARSSHKTARFLDVLAALMICWWVLIMSVMKNLKTNCTGRGPHVFVNSSRLLAVIYLSKGPHP